MGLEIFTTTGRAALGDGVRSRAHRPAAGPTEGERGLRVTLPGYPGPARGGEEVRGVETWQLPQGGGGRHLHVGRHGWEHRVQPRSRNRRRLTEHRHRRRGRSIEPADHQRVVVVRLPERQVGVGEGGIEGEHNLRAPLCEHGGLVGRRAQRRGVVHAGDGDRRQACPEREDADRGARARAAPWSASPATTSWSRGGRPGCWSRHGSSASRCLVRSRSRCPSPSAVGPHPPADAP